MNRWTLIFQYLTYSNLVGWFVSAINPTGEKRFTPGLPLFSREAEGVSCNVAMFALWCVRDQCPVKMSKMLPIWVQQTHSTCMHQSGWMNGTRTWLHMITQNTFLPDRTTPHGYRFGVTNCEVCTWEPFDFVQRGGNLTSLALEGEDVDIDQNEFRHEFLALAYLDRTRHGVLSSL